MMIRQVPHALFTAFILVLLAQPVAGQGHLDGLNLSWDDCGSAGVPAKFFACDTNSGVDVLVPSLVAPECTPEAMHWHVILQFGNNPNPDWWALGSSMCRSGSMAVSGDMTGFSACQDFWGPQAPLSFSSYVAESFGYNLGVTTLVPRSSAQHLVHGTEIYLGRIVINHQKTVGAGACGGGCDLRGSMGLVSVSIDDTSAAIPTIDWPYNRNEVSWQFDFTPTQNKTWGQIKALYRGR